MVGTTTALGATAGRPEVSEVATVGRRGARRWATVDRGARRWVAVIVEATVVAVEEMHAVVQLEAAEAAVIAAVELVEK